MNISKATIVGLGLAMVLTAVAQKGPETTLTQLPQDHEYQVVLRNFMATLTEKDFDHGVSGKMAIDLPAGDDPEYLYRHYILTMMHQPLVGTKRGWPSVNAPPELFMLSAFEKTNGVMQLPVWPETLISFVHWDYPGNLYRNNRGLKLRAFAGASAWMMMFHNFAELNDTKNPPPIRPEWHGYNPVFFAAPYPGFKDVLPAEVQKAFETGLKMVGERMLGWKARGISSESDLMAPLGLLYISRAIKDPGFTKAVEERVRDICTSPAHLHPAGYWLDYGGIDTGFGGAANLYATWIALMTDWAFVKETVERVYRLRSHLVFPDPDGHLTGPSHFNSRLGSPASADQLGCEGARDIAASLITDEAAMFVRTPSAEVLKAAPGRRAYMFNEDLGENPRVTENGVSRYIRNDEIRNTYPWKLRMWMTYNFPISVNPGYEFYRQGAFAHRQELEQKKSPWLRSPYLRGEYFIRDFAKAFVATRQPGFAALLHTGPIGGQGASDGNTPFKGPLGLSGGQLSTFWTPETGSVLLGLRSGMSHGESHDVLEAWRTWPNHAMAGATADGTFFTSARIEKPEVSVDIKGSKGTVKVSGPIPAAFVGQDKAIAGMYEYSRAFAIDDKGVRVETTVRGDGKDSIAELYEVLPVYLRESRLQPKAAPTSIEFQSGGTWSPATDQFTEKVQAVRLTRFGGAVVVRFDKPQRAKLSPADWTDGWFTEAQSRNVLIDLLAGKPGPLKEARTVAYRIEPAGK